MHNTAFLQDLALVMIAAGLVTIVFHWLKQPVVLGYILAGVLIGPHTTFLPSIHDEESVRTLADLGVILLMFSLGLEFSLRRLRKVGAVALIAAALEIVLMVAVGYQIGRAFGWATMDSIFLGAMLSISSTTIIVKALGELGKSKERFAELVFGILIVEDILAIVMIALLSTIAMTGSLGTADVLNTVGRLTIFLVVSIVVGLIAVPRLLAYVGKFRSNEMLLVTVLGLCFGMSLLAVKLKYSVALGAFLMGAVIAEAREIGRIENLMTPVRDMFSAIFFVAIGLLIEPKLMIEYAWPIAVISFAVVVGKVLTCTFGAFIAGNHPRTSMQVGMSLAQIGEFSFIIASLGLTLGVTSHFLYPIAVAVSAITTLLTPYLIRSSDVMVGMMRRQAPARLVHHLGLYTTWIKQLEDRRGKNFAASLIRRWTLQMFLNLALIAGIFFGAVYFGQHLPAIVRKMGFSRSMTDPALWFIAMLLSLPSLIAIYRKLQALGMLIADLRMPVTRKDAVGTAVRSVISYTVLFAGSVGLVLVLLGLSAALLPGRKSLVVLTILVALFAALFWRSSIRLYARIQASLHETLNQEHSHHEVPVPMLPGLGGLKGAQLEMVLVAASCPSAGRLIRETALRSQTGASVVGIERAGRPIINPGPEEELAPGDHLFLLGNEVQLARARVYLITGQLPAD